MTSKALRCPHCCKTLPTISISKEIKELKKENARLANELAYYQRGFVASAQRQIFHRPECNWAAYILNSPNLIEFASHGEAVEAGFKPCKTCRA